MRILSTTIKSLATRLLGRTMTGIIDYYRNPQKAAPWGGAFNGQNGRCSLFDSILATLRPAAIVETGTFFGTTTEYLAKTGLMVYSVESNPYAYGFARARLWKQRNVILLKGDSRESLRQLLDGLLQCFSGRTLFFYLDAHWNSDLPLAEEVDIVFAQCPAAVVMIDDFKVPDDPDYGYDSYGPGNALTPDYIAPAISAHGLAAFYPALAAADESGARRGCVVLVRDTIHGEAVASLPLLRQAGRASPNV